MHTVHSIKVLLLSLTGSVVLVLILFLFSQPDDSIKNDFNRSFRSNTLALETSQILGTNNYDFAGSTNSTLYLRDVDRPYQVIELSESVISDTIIVTNRLSNSMAHGQILIGSSSFFMADLDRYIVFKGDLSDWTIDKKMPGPNFFSEYLPLNDSILVYRAFTVDRKEYRLLIQTDADTIDGRGLIQKQIDGLFCTDGVLQFDDQSKTIVYVYYYRNQFIKADTGLQLIARQNTIDTTTVAKIAVARDEKGKYSSLSSPPHLVNLALECYNGEIFIHSNLKADNEDQKVFHRSDVIDVYNLKSGGYQYSFYVPRQGETKMTHFTLHEGKLYVIRGKALEIYHFTTTPSITNRG